MVKRLFLTQIVLLIVLGCTSRSIVDNSTLPKDISLKPERNPKLTEEETLAKEAENLRKLYISIDSIANSITCNDANNWHITAIGSKPCGGPAGYLAYHRDLENIIVPKILEYTRRQADYNRRANIFSDCAIEPQPAGLKCENGKTILIKGSSVE